MANLDHCIVCDRPVPIGTPDFFEQDGQRAHLGCVVAGISDLFTPQRP
ncbi:hypothetical protein N8D74_17915 (plasmid) [Curtobacterium flaccumfaciens]|uniref:Uncharacterized protein n=1 Tax=Curtobacterium poinsettiae TaxID=159612 RepID=A0A9Q9PBH0_9MICO|nr:hypothetical protein [Curtobacterium flaccumfaciens]MCS6563632.1 hypothetical protein [Curtobacterium flaccumfaciens pv. poinsettiae]MCU0154569.1 hypothetical protein [Curtobacterium flaccumfaciens pv. poinsettiae]UXN16893.1 hypothetical protein N8D76_17510 [Curtobacterium flaccumfaciens pv. poinsettiae]UXN27158.1 hypothetical protein N8D74_17915 [Curtobacterium flaccumfaciens]UXN30518.1 hypothetical protein N8D75_17485 [Curtobacterium flaccumfaciens]